MRGRPAIPAGALATALIGGAASARRLFIQDTCLVRCAAKPRPI